MKSLFIERIDERAKLPCYKHITDSGMDVCSLEDYTLQGRGGRHTFRLGIKAEIPYGFEIQVRPRSGLAKEYGVFAVFGTVDEGYRGEICVTMVNTSRRDYVVKAGDRIAQLVVAPVARVVVLEVDRVMEGTDRGSDGFGSTGVN